MEPNLSITVEDLLAILGGIVAVFGPIGYFVWKTVGPGDKRIQVDVKFREGLLQELESERQRVAKSDKQFETLQNKFQTTLKQLYECNGKLERLETENEFLEETRDELRDRLRHAEHSLKEEREINSTLRSNHRRVVEDNEDLKVRVRELERLLEEEMIKSAQRGGEA